MPTVDVQGAIAMAQTAAFEKAWFTYTQTAAAMPTLTSTQTLTSIPIDTIEPTFPPTAISTSITFPTDTLLPFPTDTPVVIVPITDTAPAQAVCSCAGDTLNCSDFASHASAQSCFEYCSSIGAGDIHGLDGSDGDGLACESLP